MNVAMTYVYLMKNKKDLSLEIIKRHVDHLSEVDAKRKTTILYLDKSKIR